jgi:GntR family transcriptional regulator/MocR family aminotransferase
MLMPGLRVGFLTVEGPIFDRLVNFKSYNDLATSNLIQRALEAFVSIGRYQTHLRRSRQVFRKRRDAMMTAIHHFMPAGTETFTPKGGLFAWIRLPNKLSCDKLITFAVEEGVTFAPGTLFFPESSGGEDYMRLNFTIQTPERIQEGMKRLRTAIDRLTLTSG